MLQAISSMKGVHPEFADWHGKVNLYEVNGVSYLWERQQHLLQQIFEVFLVVSEGNAFTCTVYNKLFITFTMLGQCLVPKVSTCIVREQKQGHSDFM